MNDKQKTMPEVVVVAEFLLHPESGHLLGENEDDVKPLDGNASRPSPNA